MNTKPGTLLDAFVLTIDGRDVQGEIRLVHAEDGTELLWHYEDCRLVFSHPAKRCNQCSTIITSSHAGGKCFECADGLHLGAE